tara:strand:- start:141 stop:299 length:159 start_codon:yes stop_codon:yes gene_type:complete
MRIVSTPFYFTVKYRIDLKRSKKRVDGNIPLVYLTYKLFGIPNNKAVGASED